MEKGANSVTINNINFMQLLELPFWNFLKSISDHPQYFGKLEYWLTFSVFALASVIPVMIIYFTVAGIRSYIDKRTATTEQKGGIIVDKAYDGAHTSSGSGTAIVPNSTGGVSVGVVSTSSYSPEQFLFFVKADKIYKVYVNMDEYFKYNIGDKISIAVKTGGLFHEQLSVKLL